MRACTGTTHNKKQYRRDRYKKKKKLEIRLGTSKIVVGPADTADKLSGWPLLVKVLTEHLQGV